MPDPPSKRRRTTIVEISDGSSPPRPPTRRPTTGTSGPKSPATSTVAPRRSARSASSKTKEPAESKQKAATGKKPVSSPAKPKKPAQKNSNQTLFSFFSSANESNSALPPASTGRRIFKRTPSCVSTTPTPSPNEDADDLIEEIEDDDWVKEVGAAVVLPKHTRKTPAPHLTVSKPGASQSLRGSLAKVPRPPPNPRPATGSPKDARTWPEKYGPKSTADLAVHKSKIDQVRKWIHAVLNGNSKECLLVLRGAAGTGKTATVNSLSEEMGFEVLEWKNPASAADRRGFHADENAWARGLTGLFEEFVARAGKFSSLDLAGSGEPTTPLTPPTDDGRPKIIVIEDFPNTLFTSSPTPLQSFRQTIRSFLALPPLAPGTTPLPALVLIVTETASVTGPNSFTAHRLLSPEILSHPRAHEISFNKVAPTFMLKALLSALAQDASLTNRKFGPSKPVLDALSSTGDIRSAIMGLEFLASNPVAFTERLIPGKKPPNRELTQEEHRLLASVSQRESAFGIFHAAGKVLYNKRFGDDADDAYVPPPPRPVLESHPYHKRAIRMDIDTLIDDTGTDPQTFVSALHENYIPSCNSDLDIVCNALDQMSDSDLLSPAWSFGTDTAVIRADEIAFQTAVRGVMISLPSPVSRPSKNKLYYPTSARLWRNRQEVEESVEWFVQRERVMTRAGKCEAAMERMPYLAIVEKAREEKKYRERRVRFFQPMTGGHKTDPAVKRALDKVARFKGVGGQSDDAEEGEQGEEVRGKGKWVKKKARREVIEEEVVEKLVLSDDDIEDE